MHVNGESQTCKLAKFAWYSSAESALVPPPHDYQLCLRFTVQLASSTHNASVLLQQSENILHTEKLVKVFNNNNY